MLSSQIKPPAPPTEAPDPGRAGGLIDTARLVAIDTLQHFEGNARRGNLDTITGSLRRLGQYRTVVVNRGTLTGRPNEVLAGNHTLRGARELGWTELAVEFIDVDEDTAKRINVVDNRANDQATNDDQALWDILASLPDLEGTGYDQGSLDELVASLTPQGEPTTGDTSPGAVPDAPRSQPGDVYLLGEHRLVCGSCTDALVVEKALGGDTPALVITDPPYGVNYESRGRAMAAQQAARGNVAREGKHRGKQHRPIENDALTADQTRELFRDAMTICGLPPGGAFYVTVPPGDLQMEFMLALIDAGLPARHGLVWVKDQLVFGRADYHYQHETILYGWRDGAAHYFTEDRTQTTVWEIERPKVSEEHPTMKPVELYERAMQNSSRPGAIVYDPFAGSGTAAIAAENLKRRARLVELDAGYCDVIVDRWERHTGQTAELIRDDVEAQQAA